MPFDQEPADSRQFGLLVALAAGAAAWVLIVLAVRAVMS